MNSLVESRNEVYGDPKETFRLVGKLWSSFLGVEISPEKAVVLMILLKVARQRKNIHNDSVLDIEGYANILRMFATDADSSVKEPTV